jgi:hypothetical protein
VRTLGPCVRSNAHAHSSIPTLCSHKFLCFTLGPALVIQLTLPLSSLTDPQKAVLHPPNEHSPFTRRKRGSQGLRLNAVSCASRCCMHAIFVLSSPVVVCCCTWNMFFELHDCTCTTCRLTNQMSPLCISARFTFSHSKTMKEDDTSCTVLASSCMARSLQHHLAFQRPIRLRGMTESCKR